MPRPEDAAREHIDAALIAADWVVQDYTAMTRAVTTPTPATPRGRTDAPR
jgi:hypothetical protein